MCNFIDIFVQLVSTLDAGGVIFQFTVNTRRINDFALVKGLDFLYMISNFCLNYLFLFSLWEKTFSNYFYNFSKEINRIPRLGLITLKLTE